MNYNYIDNLIDNCNKAKQTQIITTIGLTSIDELSLLNDVKTAIYIIEEINRNEEQTFLDLQKYKDTKERNCPKLNKPSNIMYIGSSTTDIKKRLKEHMGFGNKNTYSLQLKYWFKGQYKITVQVYDVSREVLQIIEDNLSYQLKPAFGKLGSNNK